MKKKWVLVSIALVITALGIMSGCSHTPEDQPWASLASKVALKINIAEDKVFDAFAQAFKEGVDLPSDSRRIQALTDDDVEQINNWYQNRPEDIGQGRFFSTIRYFGAEIGFFCSGSDAILDGLAFRVAQILGLAQQTVVTAFHEVHRESIDEMHRDGLDNLIKEGVLSKEQVDKYYSWYLTRPDSVGPGRMGPVQ
jgi:hypothetical protein